MNEPSPNEMAIFVRPCSGINMQTTGAGGGTQDTCMWWPVQNYSTAFTLGMGCLRPCSECNACIKVLHNCHTTAKLYETYMWKKMLQELVFLLLCQHRHQAMALPQQGQHLRLQQLLQRLVLPCT